MRKLPLPTYDSGEVYRTCISRVRDTTLKQRLEAVEQLVINAANSYVAAASVAQLYTIPPHIDVGGVVTKDEMTDVYTQRMAHEDGPGRAIYDQLKAAAKNGICPLCGLRTVSTIDHYLPKAHYPALAVVPANLVPACTDCNKSKLSSIPQNACDQTIHPYFDNFETETWLFAKIVESTPAAARYYVVSPLGWSDVEARRAVKHFESLKLAPLYASHAADELESIRQYMTDLLALAGAQAVKDHLRSMARSSSRVHLNSWKTALYTALSENDWYCMGGFRIQV